MVKMMTISWEVGKLSKFISQSITVYKRFNNIEEGNIVKVFGRVERRFDKYQVIVNNIQIIE